MFLNYTILQISYRCGILGTSSDLIHAVFLLALCHQDTGEPFP